MRVAITGAAGSLGRAIVKMMLVDDAIASIVAIDIHPLGLIHDKLSVRVADVRDPEIGRHLEGCDALIHCAFLVENAGTMARETIESINIGGTRNVVRAAVDSGLTQILFASSMGAYGIHPDLEGIVLDERTPTRGNDDFYYFHDKAAVERWLDQFEREHPEIAVARLRPCIFLTDKSTVRPVGLLALSPWMVALRGVDARFHVAYDGDVEPRVPPRALQAGARRVQHRDARRGLARGDG